MTTSKRILAVALVTLIFGSVGLFAADTASHQVDMTVNAVSLIDLDSTATINLVTVAPTNGGEDPVGQTDNSKLLQYTSLIASGTTRRVTTEMSVGTAPAGTSLRLVASGVSGNCGTPQTELTLSSTAQDLISTIGNCATGTGSNGATLTYTFSVDTVGSLNVTDNSLVTILFTLTDS